MGYFNGGHLTANKRDRRKDWKIHIGKLHLRIVENTSWKNTRCDKIGFEECK